MVNPEEHQSVNGRRMDDADRADQISDGQDSVTVSSSGGETSARANPASVTRRLSEIFVENGDGDLLLQRSDREDGVLQWLRALDMQVTGACRADERLKPLLKLNVSTGVAEDRLLAHLSQHFEPSEVGMLARCLCIPLVSIRVGKINKQGSLLSPTSISFLSALPKIGGFWTSGMCGKAKVGWVKAASSSSSLLLLLLSLSADRGWTALDTSVTMGGNQGWETIVCTEGNLCLTLLPTSDLRISFNGDDGFVERLATFSTEVQSIDIEIEAISADKSGRSFLIKTSDTVVSYFWCSERSTLLGNELLRKMKDLLMRKPSLAELTGISESRLDCFATHLRAYLAGSMCGSQGSKTNLIYLGSLSPRSSSFKEGQQKSLFSIRSVSREKLRRRGETHVPCIDSKLLASSNSIDPSTSNCYQKENLPSVNGTHSFAGLNFLDAFGKSTELPLSGPETKACSPSPSPFSPHYCWCPPVASALQYTIGKPQLPVSSTESFSLPPLSSLLSSARPSSLLTSKPLLNLAEVPPIDFPSLLPEPLIRLPTSQQIPTFTPLICDPIVHIPVIDVCSSGGQGYLVSAGPAISTSIPPLNPDLVDPLLPNAESVVEKGARETLRMLISSSNQSTPQLEVLPSVLSSSNDKQNVLAAGSRGLYSGTIDVDAINNSLSSMGLVFLSEKSMMGALAKRVVAWINLIDPKEKPSSSGPSSFDEMMD
ncbi:UNVERIFIED_CONTAM: hypothetical protein Sangu_0769900 [Sesamum angustifolium]|uniref:Uncharacterized protein n=1 Tax=Sesamum angustifolium TaxID=2727405 RepID=A0AAW2PSA2_9LAMI